MDDEADASTLGEALRSELSLLESDVLDMTNTITVQLAKAIIEGQELDNILRSLVLAQSNRAMNSAMSDVYSLVGNLGESVIGAVVGGITGGFGSGSAGLPTANIFNVNVATPDAVSFRNSETQLASSLSRAVARGNRAL
ncbi:MAG: hypothetical protein Rhims3KO_25940 [Hyphomicrobiales bacterium]